MGCDHCKLCPEDVFCCSYDASEGFVFVGIKDALAIKEATCLELRDFLDYSPLPDSIVKDCGDDLPESEGRFRAGIFRDGRILRMKMKDKGCYFLKEGSCSIYEKRPLICRMYPYWFKQVGEKLKIILHDEESDCTLATKAKLSTIEKQELLNIAKDIISEKEFYLANIDSFVKDL